VVVSSCFIILSVIDAFAFVFHPFEVAIVVDLEEKTEYDRALLRKLQLESENENHLVSPTNSKVQGRKQNSYLRIFQIIEYRTPLLVAMI